MTFVGGYGTALAELSHRPPTIAEVLERKLFLNRPLSLALTLGPLRQGAHDPCVQFEDGRFWWSSRTPQGPATLCLSLSTERRLHGRAWGAGAEWLLHRLPEIIGEHQDDGAFDTDNALVARLHHEMPGMRIPKTGNVWEVMLGTVLAQRVTGLEATRSFRNITKALQEHAPGPRKMLLPPAAQSIAAMPYWWFHRFGVERKRADIVRALARHANKLDGLVGEAVNATRSKLLAFPGVGLWTSASVALVALGDQDAVPVGDFHFANHVAWALAEEKRGSDKRMLELLEPFSGHRGRVLRLILHGHSGAPKFGPRYSPMPIATF